MIEIKSLYKSYPQRQGIFKKVNVPILKDIHLSIYDSETLALVGESGSGKSTLSRLILGLEDFDSGTIERKGSEKESVVFQDYTNSVNSHMTVQEIIQEPVIDQKKTRGDFEKILQEVQLPASYLSRYPHLLSGGELQRVCIARAIIAEPDLIIFDEALSSLDISVQLELMDVLIDLKQKSSITYLFITHDLSSVTYLADRVAFMKDGELIEVRAVNDLGNLSTEYARELLTAAEMLLT